MFSTAISSKRTCSWFIVAVYNSNILGAVSLRKHQNKKADVFLPKGIEHPLALLYNIIAKKDTRKRDNYTTMRDKNQVFLPINLGICIDKEDYVIKVAEICESLDYTELFNTYVRSWRKVNPITLFEILIFGYMEHKYSGRKIAKACHNDIRFMWLLNGELAPSHATISRFQDERFSAVIEG